MIKEVTWIEKYKLALKENLSVRDIMKLRSVGQPKALEIRSKAIQYCLIHNIDIEGHGVPCEVVMIITDKDISYYYDKMILESKAFKLEESLIGV